MRVVFPALAREILALFPVGSDGVVAVWQEGDTTTPSPLLSQFSGAADGARIICIPAADPAPQMTTPLPIAEYTLDVLACERFRGQTYPVTRRYALANLLTERLGEWVRMVYEGQIQPVEFAVLGAEIQAVSVDIATPWTGQGWFTAGVRIAVEISPKEV